MGEVIYSPYRAWTVTFPCILACDSLNANSYDPPGIMKAPPASHAVTGSKSLTIELKGLLKLSNCRDNLLEEN